MNVDTWRMTYRGIVPEEALARQTYEKVEGMFAELLARREKDVFNFVADPGAGEIVGIATGGPNRFKELPYGGELWAIYVLEEHQGRGIGRRLAGSVAESLLGAGYGSMIVQVLEGNPHRRFYESIGGALQDGTFEYEIEGVKLPEVVYVWPDLAALAARLKGGSV